MYLTFDRDEYVEILWENIPAGSERNYEKNDHSEVLGYGPYDYDSVMHYPGILPISGSHVIKGKVTYANG